MTSCTLLWGVIKDEEGGFNGEYNEFFGVQILLDKLFCLIGPVRAVELTAGVAGSLGFAGNIARGRRGMISGGESSSEASGEGLRDEPGDEELDEEGSGTQIR